VPKWLSCRLGAPFHTLVTLSLMQQRVKVLPSYFSTVSSCAHGIHPKICPGGKRQEQVHPGTGALVTYPTCSAWGHLAPHCATYCPASCTPGKSSSAHDLESLAEAAPARRQGFPWFEHEASVIIAFLKMLMKIALVLIKDHWEFFPHGMATHVLSTLVSQGPWQVFTADQPHIQNIS